MNADYAGLFGALRPEGTLVLGALLVLALDLSVFRLRSDERRLSVATLVACAAVLGAGMFSWTGARGPVFGGVLIFDRLAVASRLGVLTLALLTLGITGASRAIKNPAEFVAIVLFATCGLTLMAATQQLLLGFLALELASLSLYVLAGFGKHRPESAEAGIKYFLFGGMAAAFLLFGFSLIYGLTGSIELPEIAAALSTQSLSPLLGVAYVMVLVAMGFKVAAAPFHLWAPDVYEGAPTATACLVASASKLAGFTFFTRLLWVALPSAAGSVAAFPIVTGWLPAVAAIALLSMLIGNFGALAQLNLRRLLAYSAIAHSGSLLLGVLAAGQFGTSPLFYYAATYGLAALGIFGVVAMAERSGPCERITDLAGLHRRSPLLAGCLAIFVLSLAGIPPLAGFFGKFYVFASALRLGGLEGPAGWIVVVAVAMSALALYYYLIILKQALVADPPAGVQPIKVPRLAAGTLLFAAGLLVLFGIYPPLLLNLP